MYTCIILFKLLLTWNSLPHCEILQAVVGFYLITKYWHFKLSKIKVVKRAQEIFATSRGLISSTTGVNQSKEQI